MASEVELSKDINSLLLEQAANAHDIGSFLNSALDGLSRLSGWAGMAVVQSVPPEWRVIGATGDLTNSLPVDLAAEALDRMQEVELAEWTAVPLDNQMALFVRGRNYTAMRTALPKAMATALRIVDDKERRGQRIRRLEKVLEIIHTWGQSDRMESLLEAMATAATELLHADRASIFLWDTANKTLVGRPALGIKKGGELRIPENTGIVGEVVATREPRRVGGGVDDDRIARTVDRETGYTTKTLLCVPLISPKGQCLGAFEVLNKKKGVFGDDDERALCELASHAAVLLESTQQWEELILKHQQMVEAAAGGLQLIGDSPAIGALRSTIGRIADTDLAILILGENGTGKEVVARSIHYLSRRREQPFIAVNCAALSETLLESELFGHEKGAFTDARESRQGKFELASGGTLFLDEIGDMSVAGQAKLLRVLEDKTVVRVGGSQPIHTEVRILAATNQDLGKMVREKRFREDLFFRLNVVSLELPPLRERGDDVLLLANYFLDSFCRSMGRSRPQFSAAARKRMLDHRWPGNVRELRNLIERLAYLTSGERIEAEDLAFITPDRENDAVHFDPNATLTEATHDFQQKYIKQTIERAGGNMSKAAKKLGLHRSNLYRKMRQLEMGVAEEEGDDDE